jgi:hypothetical protein
LSRINIFPALSARSQTDADVETSFVSMSADIRTRRPANVSAGIDPDKDPKALAIVVADLSDSDAPGTSSGAPSAVMM